jgi:hypothetical protein
MAPVLSKIFGFQGDPLRENACELPGCEEVNNSFCLYTEEFESSSPNLLKRCRNMAESVSSWSDGA